MSARDSRPTAENDRGLWLPAVMQEPVSNVIATEPDGYSIVLCHCEQGPYLGARKAGTPCCCERCGFMTREQWDALVATMTRDVPPGVGREVDQ